MSEFSFSEIEPFSHARIIHCRLIAYDLDRSPEPIHRKPHLDFTLPDDRGALIGPGTFRLPLDRHVCAETLWRFFGDMGDRDDSVASTVDLLQSQWKDLEERRERWVTSAISVPACSHNSLRFTGGPHCQIADPAIVRSERGFWRNVLSPPLFSLEAASPHLYRDPLRNVQPALNEPPDSTDIHGSTRLG